MVPSETKLALLKAALGPYLLAAAACDEGTTLIPPEPPPSARNTPPVLTTAQGPLTATVPGSIEVSGLVEDADTSTDHQLERVRIQWEDGVEGERAVSGRSAAFAFVRSFSAPDTVSYTVIVEDRQGAQAEATGVAELIEEDSGSAENVPPVAHFESECAGRDCTFADSSSDVDGRIDTWAWDFGDGTEGHGVDPRHTYASEGTYTVALTVTDDDGASDSHDETVTVEAEPPNQDPISEFDVECDDLSCTFTDESRDEDGTVVSWNWSFGDGAESDQRNPEHTYGCGGAHTVTLTVTDDDDGVDQHSETVNPSDDPCEFSSSVGQSGVPVFNVPPGPACRASNAPELTQCLDEARAGTVRNVELSSVISCDGGCGIELTQQDTGLRLYGAPGSGAGFHRTGEYDDPLLMINGADDVLVANLVFDEGGDVAACTPYEAGGTYQYPCASTVHIHSADEVVLDRLTLRGAKRHAVGVTASPRATIRNSYIENAGVFGIWIETGVSDLLVENNLIVDSKSNGLYLSGTTGSSILANTFLHNHRVALFDVCGGPCPGGQLDLLDNADLLIAENAILEGSIDLDNATGQVSGIEINSNHSNVMIRDNLIADNRWSGIYANPSTSGISNFVITGNLFRGNEIALWNVEESGIEARDNCFE